MPIKKHGNGKREKRERKRKGRNRQGEGMNRRWKEGEMVRERGTERLTEREA